MGRKRIEITGKRFGKLIVEGPTRRDGRLAWQCRCDCGETTVAAGANLRKGSTKSCGCGEHAIRLKLIGMRFGRWLVTGFAGTKRQRGSHWNVACDCGATGVRRGDVLKSGHSKSCGCWLVESHQTHGWKGTSEYHTWQCMKDRCINPRATGYASYGGRGITVCERWRDSFENFIADMGPKTTPAHSIDRVDNNGPYAPENCRWATRKEQQRNRQNTRHVFYRGESRPLAEWCEMLNLKTRTIYTRLFQYRWSVERALTTPTAHR